jgi:hypothetical protein
MRQPKTFPFSPFDLAIDGDRVDCLRLTTKCGQPIQGGGNAKIMGRLVGQQPSVRIEALKTAEANGGPLRWRTAVRPSSNQPITVTMLRSLRLTLPNSRNDWQWWTLSGGRRTMFGGGFPWTQYNTWYGLGANFDEALLRRGAEQAAAIGVEVFVIDDGWFRGRRRRERYY